VSNPPAILFTGFEPSGDDHAAAVIAELRRRHPDLPMYAWGGPKMEAAGAVIVEQTGRDAVMGMPGLAKIQEHKRINARIEKWLADHPVAVHVPVDSPAANFPICRLTRASGAKVVHLVAPQVWAWASWRVRKLRRLSNFVCCVLPFEEDWFRKRGVRAGFVGHPLFDEPLDLAGLDESIKDWAQGKPKLLLLPGSRPAEIRKNFPLLMASYRRIAREHPEMVGVVAATRADLEGTIRDLAGGPWPESLQFVAGQTDEAIRWADLALVVSGTVTLQVARQHTPMVVFYKLNWFVYNLFARWLIRTPFLSLPNLIAGNRIVPELIPHFGGTDAIVDEAVGLLERPELVERQVEALCRAVARFDGRHAAQGAADVIERVAGLVSADGQAS